LPLTLITHYSRGGKMVELTHYSRGIWCCCCWLWLEGISPSLHPSLFWVHMFITVFNVHIELVWSMEKYGHPQISKRQIYVRGIILFKRMTLMLPAAMVAGTLCFPPYFWNSTIDYFLKCDRNMQSNKQNASGNKLLQGMIVIYALCSFTESSWFLCLVCEYYSNALLSYDYWQNCLDHHLLSLPPHVYLFKFSRPLLEECWFSVLLDFKMCSCFRLPIYDFCLGLWKSFLLPDKCLWRYFLQLTLIVLIF
jgi:hypothetical protein